MSIGETVVKVAGGGGRQHWRAEKIHSWVCAVALLATASHDYVSLKGNDNRLG